MKTYFLLFLLLIGTTYNLKSTNYYVNDNSLVGDVFTYSVGLLGNNGLTKSTPKLSLTSVLSTYSVSFLFGDTIFIDTGNYTEIQLSSPINGVVIKGAGLLYTKITKSGSDRYFMLINDNNTVLSDLKLTGYDNQTISGVQTLGIVNNIIGVKIINVQVDGSLTSSTGGGYPIEVGSGVSALFIGGGATCNTWDAGGGMHIAGTTSTITIKNYQFIGNYQLWGNGTALNISGGFINIYNTRFESNTIGGDKSGMGIDMTIGTVNVYDSYFYKNQSNILSNNIGGAVSIHGGNFRITRSIFSGNTPQPATSGIYGAGIGVTGGIVTIDSCGFTGNIGARANDVYVNGGVVLSRNCSYNSATNQVGQAGGTFSISSCGTPGKYGTVTSINTITPTYTANPILPDYLPIACVAIPCSTPTINSATPTSTICSGGTYTTNFSATTFSSQTSYSWTSSAVAGITGHSTTGNGNITETLINTGATTLTVTYSVMPIFNLSCNGPISVYTVSVYPTTTIAAASSTICSGNTATISPSGSASYTLMPGSLTGTTFTFSPISTTIYTLSGVAVNGCPIMSSTVSIVVNSNPTASISIPSTLTCSSKTISLMGSGGGTYSWTGPGIVSGSATATPSINVMGNYILTVTNNGCSNTASVSVTQNTTTPIITATNSNTLTCATTTVFLTGTGGGSYNWSGPGIIGGAATSSPTVNLPGTYNLTVTAANGCTSSTNTSVSQNITSPTITASSSTTLTCSTPTVLLTSSGGGTYSWIGPGILSGSLTANPIVNLGGNYVVTVTSSLNGCVGSYTLSVPTNTLIPTMTLTPSSVTTTCAAPTVTISAISDSDPNSLYTWTVPSTGLLNNTSISNPIASGAGIFTVVVTNTISGCVSSTQTVSITADVNTPTLIATSSETAICAGGSTILFVTGTDTYTWSSNTGSVNTNSVLVNPSLPLTTYSVVGTNTLTGCSNFALITITVNATPTIGVSSNLLNVCEGNSAIITLTGATNYTVTNPSMITTNSVLVTPTVQTTYTVVGESLGCLSVTNTITIDVNSLPQLSVANQTTCAGSKVTLVATNADTYTWTPSGIMSNSFSVSPTTNATYSVAGTNTLTGCTSTLAIVSVTVNDLPIISLISNVESACENASAQLAISNPNSAYSYSWLTNSTIVSSGTSLIFNPLLSSNAGVYLVSVTDANGCKNSVSGQIDVLICDLFIPEIFTPNGDGKNDGFVIKNVENYPDNTLKIFNRWGNLIYQKDGYLNEFEGYSNTENALGKDKLPAGTYFVVFEYGGSNTKTYNGYLLLQY